jgi:hypothetical protein
MDERLLMKKVLVLGDSFTAGHNCQEYHWLNQLANAFNWQITNRSISGSGPLYVIDMILRGMSDARDYDIIIFAWSEPTRFYHPQAPWLNAHETAIKAQFKPGQEKLYAAADLWYKDAIDYELEEIKGTGLQYWFDNYLAENFADREIYHVYCFPRMGGRVEYAKYLDSCADINNQTVYHQFKTGVSILPTLIYYSVNDPNKPKNIGFDHRLGHISEDSHHLVFRRLATLFSQPYQSGKVFHLNE